MSSKNVEFLRKCHEAFSAHNFDEAMKLVAPTCHVVDHGRSRTFNSRQEFRGWLEAFTAMSSDIKLVEARYIDGGEYVTAMFRGVGTQDGPMAGTPFGASNKPFSLDVCEVWRFNADGEAVEGHNYSDGFGLLMQLGHLPAPA
jgi:hypothetical protein